MEALFRISLLPCFAGVSEPPALRAKGLRRAAQALAAAAWRRFAFVAAEWRAAHSSIEFFFAARFEILLRRRCKVRRQRVARLRITRIAAGDSRPLQRPSRRFNASLTACGLALPPVDFITCPTNQPSMPGFALACSAFSGLAAMTASTAASIAPVSVT
jgi:hypothetical protein